MKFFPESLGQKCGCALYTAKYYISSDSLHENREKSKGAEKSVN